MSVKILGTYEVGDYNTILYPEQVCTNCPFFHDGVVSWCGWYKEKIEDINFNENCKIKKIEVEEE